MQLPMNRYFLLILFTSLSANQLGVDAQCVHGRLIHHTTCTCEYKTQYKIQCCKDGTQMDVPPSNIPSNTKNLRLNSCGIKRLPDGWCSQCKDLQFLSLVDNSLQTVNSGAYQGLTQVTQLFLTLNNLSYVQPGVFSPLRNLQILELNNNPHLGLDVIKNSTKGLSSRSTLSLFFSNINLNPSPRPQRHILEDSDLSGIKQLGVEMLGLAHVNLTRITPQAIQDMEPVECLTLENNNFNISTMDDVLTFVSAFKTLENLEVLDLNGQNNKGASRPIYSDRYLKTMCKIARKDKKCSVYDEPNLATLPSKNRSRLVLPSSLSHLYIQDNPGNYEFGNFYVTPIKNVLTHISMQNSGRMTLSGPITGLDCLTNLTLTNTSLTIADPSTLASLPALGQLRLSNCAIKDQALFAAESVFHDMTVLDLSRNELSRMSFGNLRKAAPRLEKLLLDYNNFKSVPVMHSTTLRLLNFSHNQVRYFTKDDQKALETLFEETGHRLVVDVSYNPFRCGCKAEELDFVRWMQKYSTLVKFYGYNYYQCSPDGRKRENILQGIDVFQARLECQTYLIIGLAVGLASVIFFILGTVLAYRKKWFLKYQLLKLRHGCCRRGRGNRNGLNERTPLVRKVYIIYSEHSQRDRQFARDEVDPLLRSLNLSPLHHSVFHQDDSDGELYFELDATAPNNIFKALEDTACGIALISEEFLENPEMMLALSFAQGHAGQYLLPVIVRPIPVQKLLDMTNKKFATVRGYLRLPRTVEWEASGGDQSRIEAAREEIRSWVAARTGQ